jgi:hypothetical protein
MEKIKEKMDLLQERIYTTKTSSSAIKKSDYVLSKNKFTQNLLQNNPLKEEKKNQNFTKLSRSKLINKRKKKDFYYFSALSTFLNKNRILSSKGNKKLNKIKFNKEFFSSINLTKQILNSKSTSRSKRKTREINSATPNKVNKKLSLSNILMYKNFTNNKKNRFSFLKDNYNSTRYSSNNINNKIVLTDYNNQNKNTKHVNDIINIKIYNFNKNGTSERMQKILSSNNINRTQSDKSFDFMNPNLDCTGNEKIKNIPIIIKETKNSKRYKLLYDKDRIKKINSFFFESSLNKNNH